MTLRHTVNPGVLSGLLFFCSLAFFSALRPDYSQFSNSVSELGAVGSANARAFNLFGLTLPGLLVAAVSIRLHRAIESQRRSLSGPLLLGMSGAGTALMGLAPGDLSDIGSMSSVLHVFGNYLAGVTWIMALLSMRSRMSGDPRWRSFGRWSPLFGLFLLVNILWQAGAGQLGLAPGVGQRLSFAGYFLWLAIAGTKAEEAAQNAH